MGVKNGNAQRPRQVHQNEIDEVKMADPNSAFKHLWELICHCLARGLSQAETSEHDLKELLQAAASGTLPRRNRCDDAAAHSQPQG
jgi:hypothetical protein